MKATGIVRYIDCAGRLTLPKEFRKVNNIPEGTPLEMFTEGESLIIRKYQPELGIADKLHKLMADVENAELSNKDDVLMKLSGAFVMLNSK